MKKLFVCIFKTGCDYVAQPSLESTVFFLQPPRCWGYRCASSYLALATKSL